MIITTNGNYTVKRHSDVYRYILDSENGERRKNNGQKDENRRKNDSLRSKFD